MLRLVADVNTEGHLQTLIHACRSESWREIWLALEVEIVDFAKLGLARNTPDSLVWAVVQRAEAVLMTVNRNEDGPDSLEATIRRENTLESLPVITISSPDRLKADKEYLERAAETLLVYLMEIEQHRGAGRLYIPGSSSSRGAGV